MTIRNKKITLSNLLNFLLINLKLKFIKTENFQQRKALKK
jgi:hypothetical protein